MFLSEKLQLSIEADGFVGTQRRRGGNVRSMVFFKHQLNAFFVGLCLFEIVHTTLLSKSSEQPKAVVATKASTASTTQLRIIWLYGMRKQDLVRPHPQR